MFCRSMMRTIIKSIIVHLKSVKIPYNHINVILIDALVSFLMNTSIAHRINYEHTNHLTMNANTLSLVCIATVNAQTI